MYENEVEIDLIDLCIELLKHWRGLLVCILLGGIIGAGVSYVQNRNAYTASLEQEKLRGEADSEDVDVEALIEPLTEEQLADVQAAVAYAGQIDYVKTSTLMNLDADAVPTAKLILQLKPDMDSTHASEDVTGLSVAMVELLTSPDYYQSMKKEADLNGDMRDLYQVYRNAGDDNSILKNVSVDAANTFNLSIQEDLETSFLIAVVLRGESEEMCEQLADSTMKYMDDSKPKLEKLYGDYEMVELSRSIATLADTSIQERQTAIANNYKTMRANYDDLRNNFTEEEKAYYSYLDPKYKDVEKQEAEEGSVSVGISKKTVLIGLFLGVFLCLAVLSVLYIFDTHLKDSSDIERMFRLSELGRVDREGTAKYKTVIDERIRALKYHGKRRMGQKESVELIATAIGMLMSKKNLKRIALVGMDLTAGADVICKEIAELVRLKYDNAEIEILNNIIYDAAAMEELKKVEAAALVETAGNTLNTELAKELEELSRHKVEILGGVVVC